MEVQMQGTAVNISGLFQVIVFLLGCAAFVGAIKFGLAVPAIVLWIALAVMWFRFP